MRFSHTCHHMASNLNLVATFTSSAVDPEGLRCSLFHSQFIPQSPQAFILLPPSVDALLYLSCCVCFIMFSPNYGSCLTGEMCCSFGCPDLGQTEIVTLS